MSALVTWLVLCALCTLPFAGCWVPQGQPWTGVLCWGAFVGTTLYLSSLHQQKGPTP